MPQSQAWSDDVYDVILQLSMLFDSQTVSALTGVGQRTVEITLAWYEAIGRVTVRL
jgi:hypothetical protein